MSGAPSPFDACWERIGARSGEFFKTQRGVWFTYRLEGETLLPSRTDLRIPRADFELAFNLVPLPGPAKIGKYVTGANYVWAVLHDERISEGRW